jgi:tellurite resistance protein
LLGRRASNARFAAALDNIAADPNAVPALIDRLRHLGSAGNALLVAKAAAWVAYADGVLDPRERAFFRAMRPALGIWPATSVGDGAPAGI